jgi:hypothetical protein
MFDRLKFSASALVGFCLGVALALPLFWIGVKSSVGSLEEATHRAFARVQARQQNMADECLRLEQTLAGLKLKFSRRDFADVELLRSRLAGSGDFEDQIEVSQQLERALVNVETQYKGIMASQPRAAADAFCRKFGLDWDPLKRYLVDEEFHFSSAVKEYNRVLHTSPVPWVVGHPSFGACLVALAEEMRLRLGEDLVQGLAWLKYFPRLGWAKISGAAQLPEPPKPLPVAPFAVDALYAPLPEPVYVAEAPLPEEDYPEIQYDRQAPDMADVEKGGEKAVLENATAKPYAAPIPTIQRTATYN